MITHSNQNRTASMFLAVTLIVAAGVVAAYASVAMSGTKTGAVLAAGATIGPALVYTALTAPLVFPFGALAALTPFDSLLNVSLFGTATRLLGLATGGAMLFYMFRTRRFVAPDRSLIWWILLTVWMAASVFWALDPPSSLLILPTVVQLLALYGIATMFPMDMRKVRIAVVAAALGGVSAAAYGIYLFEIGAAVKQSRLWIQTDSSTLNPDHFAASLILPIALTLIAMLWSRTRLVQFGAAVAALMMMLAIALSGSRGALLGLLAALLYLVIWDRHRLQLAAMSFTAGSLAMIWSGASLIERIQIAGSTGGAGRTDIWQIGWIALKAHWLIGAGYANFPFAYDQAFLSSYERLYTDWHRAPHNILLGTTVELGVIGTILLVLAWIGEFRMLRTVTREDARYPIRLAIESAIIGLFVTGMFADIMIWKYVWLAFILAALTRNVVTPELSGTPSSRSTGLPAGSTSTRPRLGTEASR